MYVHSVCVSISLQYVVKKLTAAVVEQSVLDIIKNAHTFFFFFLQSTGSVPFGVHFNGKCEYSLRDKEPIFSSIVC